MSKTKSYVVFAGLMLFFLSFYSCLNSITGEGEITYATRNIDTFTKIELDLQATVILTDSLEQSCMVGAQQNLMAVIETKIKGNKLIISSEKNITDSKPVTIYLSTNRLYGIELNGSGKIIGNNIIKTDKLVMDISGSGSIDIAVVCNKVTAEISGSGNLQLKGSSNESRFAITGSGEIEAFEHNTGNCKIVISGSGDAFVFPSGELNASITGSGNIEYKGNPKNIKSSVSGSGAIEKSE